MATVSCLTTLVPEQEPVLRTLECNRETDSRIVGEIGSQGDVPADAVAFVQETPDFWKASFTPLPASQEKCIALMGAAFVPGRISNEAP